MVLLIGISSVCLALAVWFSIPDRKPAEEYTSAPDWYDSVQRTHFLDTVSLVKLFEIKDAIPPEKAGIRQWIDSLALWKDGKGPKPDYSAFTPLPVR